MQRRLTLIAAAVLLVVIGLLPVLMMVANSFVVDGVPVSRPIKRSWPQADSSGC